MRLDDFCYFNQMIPRCIRTSAHTERLSASCVVLENTLEQKGAYNSNHNTVVRQAFYQPLLPSLVAAAGGTTSWSPGPLRYAVAVLYHGTGSSCLLCALQIFLLECTAGRSGRWDGRAWLLLLVSWETQGGRQEGRWSLQQWDLEELRLICACAR